VDFRAGMDDMRKGKFFTSPGLNSDPSVVQRAGSSCTDRAKKEGLYRK
jgi:hypothetical protein